MKRRNALVMANEDWIPYRVMIYITDLASDVRRSNSSAHNQSTKIPRIVNWCLPLPGQVKLNIDGSSLGNPGRIGFGCLSRCDKDSIHAISLVKQDIPHYHSYATIAIVIRDLLTRS
ncbi:unnamed protein product [Lupinus luteus]|uniref:RNase H type-1 domain-containing protein n=1 Tax=Lupinus luteus TaxID=3873 RepID=A0AAV1Y4P6_LUPLU